MTIIGIIVVLYIAIINFNTMAKCEDPSDIKYDPEYHYIFKSANTRHRLISTVKDLYAVIFSADSPRPHLLNLKTLATKPIQSSNITYETTQFFTYYKGKGDYRFPVNIALLTGPAIIIGNNRTQNNNTDIAYNANDGNGDNWYYCDGCQINNFTTTTNILWSEAINKWVAVDFNRTLLCSSDLKYWSSVLNTSISPHYMKQWDYYPYQIIEFFSLTAVGQPGGPKWVVIFKFQNAIFYDIGDISYNTSVILADNYLPSQSNPLDIFKQIQFTALADIDEFSKYLLLSSSVNNGAVTKWNTIIWTLRTLSIKYAGNKFYLIQTPVVLNSKKPIANHYFESLNLKPGDNPLECFKSTSYILSATFVIDLPINVDNYQYGFLLHKGVTKGIIVLCTVTRWNKSILLLKKNFGTPFNIDNFDSSTNSDSRENVYNINADIKKFLVIVDISSIEIFIEDGLFSASLIAFPGCNNEIGLFTKINPMAVTNLNVTLFN